MAQALGALLVGCLAGAVLAFTLLETTPLTEAEVARAEAWRECNLIITGDFGGAFHDLAQAVEDAREE
jgi:hypothetical protein